MTERAQYCVGPQRKFYWVDENGALQATAPGGVVRLEPSDAVGYLRQGTLVEMDTDEARNARETRVCHAAVAIREAGFRVMEISNSVGPDSGPLPVVTFTLTGDVDDLTTLARALAGEDTKAPRLHGGGGG